MSACAAEEWVFSVVKVTKWLRALKPGFFPWKRAWQKTECRHVPGSRHERKKMAVHRGRIDHCLFFKDTSLAVVGAVSAHCPNRDLLQQGTKIHHLAQLYYGIIWLHGVIERLTCASGWKYFNASLCRLFAAIHCAGWWGYGDELNMIPALKEFSA